MIGESTAEGWEARLLPRGAGRFVAAGFLGFWLCGWAVGEVFALTFLFMGARALITGEPPRPGAGPLAPGPALAVGGFLLVWLTLWTFGGIAAMGELLRSLWSDDRVAVGPDGLTVRHRIGPFRSRRGVPRDQLRWVQASPCTRALTAETATATVELSKLGTPLEREELAATLRAKLGFGQTRDAAQETGALPEGWQEAVVPEGGCALVPDPARRRRQARVAAGAAMALGAGALWLVLKATNDLALAPLAAMACAAAAGLAWGALWLWRGRQEWVLGSGRILLRRRFGPRLRDVFEARSLELVVFSDGDGDTWYGLEALAAAEPEPVAPWTRRRGATRSRRPIAHSIRDPVVPRRLGAWLAQRAGLPLRDRTTEAARTADLATLRAGLEKTGKVGQLAARLIGRVQLQKNAQPKG